MLNYLFLLDIITYNYFANLNSQFLNFIFRIFTELGSWYFALSIIIIFTVFLLKKKLYEWILFFYVSVISAQAITYLIKILVNRPRPLNELLIQNNFSFPSGHATIAASMYLFIAYYFYSQRKYKNTKKLIAISASLLVLCVGFSRIFLSVHYLSDVLVGYLIGFLGFYLGKYLLAIYK